jgi:hypothetical protein
MKFKTFLILYFLKINLCLVTFLSVVVNQLFEDNNVPPRTNVTNNIENTEAAQLLGEDVTNVQPVG